MRRYGKQLISFILAFCLLTSSAGDLGLFALAAPVRRSRELTASDGLTYRVTVSWDTDDGIPADAELNVTELKTDDANYAGYVAATAAALGEESDILTLTRAFDIALCDPDTGAEYEPTRSVRVSIALLDDDLDNYCSVDVVHLHDGAEAEVMESAVEDGTVSFDAGSFSVYVIAGSDIPLMTYVFFDVNENGCVIGEPITQQKVTNGERPLIPQPVSSNTRKFIGWYTGADNGDSVDYEALYDFDSVPEFTGTDNNVTLFAKYAQYVHVVFHDQYDSENSIWPVAYTRTKELVTTTDPDTHETTTSAKVRIRDLSVSYTGGDSLGFFGWSEKPIQTAGEYKDPDTGVFYTIQEDEITYTSAAEVHLYPIFREINWLTFYTAQSGLGAEYVPSAYVFKGEGLPNPLPTTSRKGYTFRGWYTGTLYPTYDEKGNKIETVIPGERVTDANGELYNGTTPILPESSGGVYVDAGKLFLATDATLYAMWGATYNVVVWKQKTTDSPDADPKHYEYAETVTLPCEIGEEVSARQFITSHEAPSGFTLSARADYDTVKTIQNVEEITVLNVYYDLADAYIPSGTAHTLTFADSEDGTGIAMPSPVENLSYGYGLSSISVANPADRYHNGNKVYTFSGWYIDRACTIRAFLHEPSDDELEPLKILDSENRWTGEYKLYKVYTTMPDHDLTLYAGWESEWYVVTIDTNYGALYHYDNTGALTGSGATWFWNSYDSEPIGEYTHISRDYVESSAGDWYYVNHDSSDKWPDRYTYYTKTLSEATGDTTYEYAPGAYSYIGWHEVFADGTEDEELYDFTQHTDHYTTLRMRWKKSGLFYLGFDAGDGLLDNDEEKDIEAAACSDYAGIMLQRTARSATPGSYFVGWRLKGDEAGTIYTSGQVFTLHADDAVRENGKDVVWLEAVYEKNTASIVYDANGGTLSSTTTDFGYKQGENGWVKVSGTFTPDLSAPTAIRVTGLVNNTRVILSGGAGFIRDGKAPVGWSNKPVCDTENGAQFYALGSLDPEHPESPVGEYGVNTVGGDINTLYAVWDVKVTYHLNIPADATDAGQYGWGGDWSGYTLEDGSYTKNIYLGTAVSEPTVIPSYTGTNGTMFMYWATKSVNEQNETVYTRYDFTAQVQGDLELYAFWRGPIEVPVHAVDASAQTIVDAASLQGWTIHNILAGTSQIDLADTAATYVTAPTGYRLAFVAAHDATEGLQTISEDEAITSICYNQSDKHLHVVYVGGRDAFLDENMDIYFVYYQEKTLSISYESMSTGGTFNSLTVDAAAPKQTTALWGETVSDIYDMAAYVAQPLSWAGGSYTYYAYAIGDTGAQSASDLSLITPVSYSDSSRPTLYLRNTWRGLQYATQTGEDAEWVDCGYEPALYVVYFAEKPVIIMIHEETVGTSAEMDTGFEYHIVVKQTETTGGTSTTSTVYDSDENEGHMDLYELKSGQVQSAVLFYSNDGTTETSQSIYVTQKDTEASAVFVTTVGGVETKTWSATSTADGGTIEVTFTNTRASIPVEVHVARLENGSVVLGDATYRSADEDNYRFDIALNESADFLTTKPAMTVYPQADADGYAIGAIVYGTDANGIVSVTDMGVSSVSYKKVNGNLCELLLNGDADMPLGAHNIYYLYYPIPTIQYVKLVNGSGLTRVQGSTNGTDPTDMITYDKAMVTMNSARVEQGQLLSLLPLNGVRTISQAGNNFRMPANLDDGIYPRYLSYSMIGAGAADAAELSIVDASEGQTTMHVGIRRNGQSCALQYSFDGSEWTSFPTDQPTIYAVYNERGYDLLITKNVNTSGSGAKPIFTGATFTLTITSPAITKSSYAVEGYTSATVAASDNTIVLENVGDGTAIRIKALGQGTYTITESGSENYLLTGRESRIVSGGTPVDVLVDGSTISLELNKETKLELTNTPRQLCRIIDSGTTNIFYTFADAMAYVERYIADLTATVEMLSDYLMPIEDAAEIPHGYHITLKTATDTMDHTAVITRSESMKDTPLFRSDGKLDLTEIVLDGAGIEATKPLIQSGDDLVVGLGAVLRRAKNPTGNGGAVNATAGDITVRDGAVIGITADEDLECGNTALSGGAIFYTGSGTISLEEAVLCGNTSTGDGGAIYAEKGEIHMSKAAGLKDNSSGGNGGAIYAGNAIIEIGRVTVSGNTALSGGAIYADTAALRLVKEGDYVPVFTGNRATAGNGGAIRVDKGTITVSGVSMTSNSASGTADADSGNPVSGDGGAIWAGSADVAVSGGTFGGSETNANTASRYGGAVFASSGAVTVSGSAAFARNSAANGGAIYAVDGAVSVKDKSSLTGNYSTSGNGGAIYVLEGNLSLTGDDTDGVVLSGNKAGYASNSIVPSALGGAAYVGNGTVTLENVTAVRNGAKQGGVIYASTGSVTVSDSSFGGEPDSDNSAKANTAEEYGGVIYAARGFVTLTDSDLIKNTAKLGGGAIYAGEGGVSLTGGSITGNTVSNGNGGVINTVSGAVTMTGCTGVTGNTASMSGGVVYTTSGNVTVTSESSLTANTATGGNGGAIYSAGGSVTLSGSSLTNNTAPAGNGGAIYAGSGTVSVTGTSSLGGNSATSGGAIYAGSGALSMTDGSVTGNSATAGNGGAIYACSGAVVLTSITAIQNTATGTAETDGNGGVLYIESGNATVSGGTYGGSAANANTALRNGGALWSGSGTLTVNGAAKLNNNQAVNGAAIFIKEGTGVIASNNTAIQDNIASDNGGAVSVDDPDARLFFADNVTIKNNRQQSSTGPLANVYLNQDSDSIITANGLGGSAEIGIYVPGAFDDDLFTHRGAASALFGSFTSDSNLGKFKNDRNSNLSAEKADNNKIRWVKKITVEVRYLASFTDVFPPENAGTTLFTLSNYVMPSSENGASQVAADIFANYNTDKLKEIYPDAGFAGAYLSTSDSFGNYVTDVNWNGAGNSSKGQWEFTKRGSDEPYTGNKLIIYFSESTYLSLVNNTAEKLTMNLSKIGVLDMDAVAGGYGYVTAKNGMTAEKLMPITTDDLTIPAGHSIKLLFPGAVGESITLEGAFDNSSAPDVTTIKYKADGEDKTPNLPVSFVSSDFAEGVLTLPNNGGTREILFGESGLSICKVEEDDSEWPSLMAAMNHIAAVKNETGNTVYTIGMLVDYLQPPNDVLNIPNGYDITLTTDKDYSGEGKIVRNNVEIPAATLSRDAGNLGAMIISDQNTIKNNAFQAALTIENLNMDGRALVGTGDGGALKTKNATVAVNNVFFKGFEATNGGALYVQFDTSNTPTHAYQKTDGDYLATMTITNTDFLNCRSSSNVDKTGGGALWTNARVLTLENCDIIGSSCYRDNPKAGSAQAGAIFHNIKSGYSTNTHTVIRTCSFKDCYVIKASGGAVESDALDVVVEDCVFDTCYVKSGTKNGGGLNIYANDSEDPNVNSRTTIRNTQFINCTATKNGGAFRTTSENVTMENVSFSKCKASIGGAFAATGKYSKELTISGSSFVSCTSTGTGNNTGGGGVYTTANKVIINDYTDSNGNVTHSLFANCQSTNEGGGIFQDRDKSSFSMTNAIVSGNASTSKTGGGICTKAKTVTITGGTISNNTSKNEGGGFFQKQNANNDSSFMMSGTIVTGNKSSSKGGGIYTNAYSATITGGSISGNSATDYGGGILVEAPESPNVTIPMTITGTTISENISGNSGGGLAFDSLFGRSGNDDRNKLTLTISGCTIDGNTAAGTGGGIYTLAKTLTVQDYTYTVEEGGVQKEKTLHTSVSGNTAGSHGGGIYHHRELEGSKLDITNATISGNRANGSGSGGGVFTSALAVELKGTTISRNTAVANGGGLWHDTKDNVDANRDNMTLLVTGSSIDENTTSTGNGGGIYTLAKSVYIQDGSDGSHSSVSGNRAAQNGGGIFHNRSVTGSSFTVTGASVNTNKATGTGNNGFGGGVYTSAWTVKAELADIKNNTATNSGGGLYVDNSSNRNSMKLDILGCTLEGNSSGVNGGGVYTSVKELVIGKSGGTRTTIKSCTATGSGGGIYHNNYQNAGDPPTFTSISDCTVESCMSHGTSTDNDGGGGVFSNTGTLTITNAVFQNNTASSNGGAVRYNYYRAFDPTAVDDGSGGLTVDNCTMTGNTADMGGAIYTRSFLRLRNNSSITNNRLSTSAAENAAGVYLIDNMALVAGNPDAGDTGDTLYIRNNSTSTGAPSNLRLWSKANLENDNHSVYVKSRLHGEIRVVNANKVGTHFGNWMDNVDMTSTSFEVEEYDAVFKADYDTYYGGVNRSDASRKQIIWVGPAVCKLTDGNGNLLYLNFVADGETATGYKGADPAIFDKLDDSNPDGSKSSAFNLLRNPNPTLYYADGLAYEGTEFCVKMLVSSFTTEKQIRIDNYPGRSITLTTAGRNDADYQYEYSETYKTKGNTATVVRGSLVGDVFMIDAKTDLKIKDIVLDGGSLNSGIEADANTGILKVDQAGITVTLDGATLQNATTTGNGGGVYVNTGTFEIGDYDQLRSGSIRNCRAVNGGAIYASTNATVTLYNGTIFQCTASGNGGGIYIDGASGGSGGIRMTGGTIERCTADDSGGGVFVGDGKEFSMSGYSGRIVNNYAVAHGGGIAVGGNRSRLVFSARPTITGNTCAASLETGKKCNVELPERGQYSNEIIHVGIRSGDRYIGLSNGANIGVYVPGVFETESCYDYHGLEQTPFGNYDAGGDGVTGVNTQTFYSFVNDRNGLKGGLLAGTSENLIYWVKIFSLEVSKSGDNIPADAEFTFDVELRGTATVPGQADAGDIKGEYGGMTFTSNGTISTATVTLHVGENCIAENLSDGLEYIVTERLTDKQKEVYASVPAQYKGTIGENNKESVEVAESERYISRAAFVNIPSVCKITDRYGSLLYRKADGAQDDAPHIPAVFPTLEAAVNALSGTLYTGINYNAAAYTIGGEFGVQIEMLVDYSITETIVMPSLANGASVKLTTASTTPKETDTFVFQGDPGVPAKITRKSEFNTGPMFIANGTMTVAFINLNGATSGTDVNPNNGGIFQVRSGGKLTIASGATLQNSQVSSKGGAVYVADGATLTMSDGTIQNNQADSGGAVYVEANGTMRMSGGTIKDNKADTAGAGVYLKANSTLELSGSPSFGSSIKPTGGISESQSNIIPGSLVGQTNGGLNARYPVKHQDIFLEETDAVNHYSLVITGNLSGSEGAIWVWADSDDRCGMANPFAEIAFSGEVQERTYTIFRNAQLDTKTFASSKYLTGDTERVDDPTHIHWTGGFDLLFAKTDGFGEPLAGAIFTLYKKNTFLEADVFKRNGKNVTATSAAGTGVVLFEKIPAGTYYMKETGTPEGYEQNTKAYLVLVGQAEFEKYSQFGLASKDLVTGQASAYKTKYPGQVKGDYAIFLLGENGSAVTTPDIAAYGIMNTAKATREVILRKVAEVGMVGKKPYEPLSGREFTILRIDRTVVRNDENDETFETDASGFIWCSDLPYGKYYLHEASPNVWFTVTVNATGVFCSKQRDSA